MRWSGNKETWKVEKLFAESDREPCCDATETSMLAPVTSTLCINLPRTLQLF
jgi:hypothetical protein